MCISAVLAAAAAAAPYAGAAATVYGANQARKAGGDARRAAERSDTMATQTANARLAQRRRALSANSLVTDQSAGASGMASGQRATLGGG